MHEKPVELKGKYFGNCNRTDCQQPGAIWYNHSTRKYYCMECAEMLNKSNHTDAHQLFGHDLCTQGLFNEPVVAETGTTHNPKALILDKHFEYLDCEPGAESGKIRLEVEDLDGNGSRHIWVVPFNSDTKDETTLSESGAISYLKYLLGYQIWTMFGAHSTTTLTIGRT